MSLIPGVGALQARHKPRCASEQGLSNDVTRDKHILREQVYSACAPSRTRQRHTHRQLSYVFMTEPGPSLSLKRPAVK